MKGPSFKCTFFLCLITMSSSNCDILESRNCIFSENHFLKTQHFLLISPNKHCESPSSQEKLYYPDSSEAQILIALTMG